MRIRRLSPGRPIANVAKANFGDVQGRRFCKDGHPAGGISLPATKHKTSPDMINFRRRNPFGRTEMIPLSRLLSLVTTALFSAALLMAQFDSGQISGFVRDQTAAIVP